MKHLLLGIHFVACKAFEGSKRANAAVFHTVYSLFKLLIQSTLFLPTSGLSRLFHQTPDSSQQGVNMLLSARCWAAQFSQEFLPQTPSLTLTQAVTPYEFWGPYDIVLQRPESFEVGHFISILALKCPTSKLSGRDKTMSQGPKNRYGVTAWVSQ